MSINLDNDDIPLISSVAAMEIASSLPPLEFSTDTDMINLLAEMCDEECQRDETLSNTSTVNKQSSVSNCGHDAMFIKNNQGMRPEVNNEYNLSRSQIPMSHSRQSIEFSASTSNIIKSSKPKRRKTVKTMVEKNYILEQVIKFKLLERFLASLWNLL